MSNYQGSVPDTRRTPDWRDNAACLEEKPELFFPKGYEGPWQSVIADAKAVCRRCPSKDACLEFALDENIGDGIFGGLTEKERAGLRRQAARRILTPEQAAEKAAKTLQPRTLQSIYDAHTRRLYGGHVAWSGPRKVSFQGKTLTVKQLCFIVGRGHKPDGPVRSDCGIDACVLPQHLADTAERSFCGTRPGYRRHLRNGEEACDRCRQANTDADNRLRRTGTSKVAA